MGASRASCLELDQTEGDFGSVTGTGIAAEALGLALAPGQCVSYEDAGCFGRLFRRKVNLAPAQYRRRFGSMQRMLETGP